MIAYRRQPFRGLSLEQVARPDCASQNRLEVFLRRTEFPSLIDRPRLRIGEAAPDERLSTIVRFAEMERGGARRQNVHVAQQRDGLSWQ